MKSFTIATFMAAAAYAQTYEQVKLVFDASNESISGYAESVLSRNADGDSPMKQFENFLESEVWEDLTDDMWLALVNTQEVYDSLDALVGEIATMMDTVYDMIKDFDWAGVPLTADQIQAGMKLAEDPEKQQAVTEDLMAEVEPVFSKLGEDVTELAQERAASFPNIEDLWVEILGEADLDGLVNDVINGPIKKAGVVLTSAQKKIINWVLFEQDIQKIDLPELLYENVISGLTGGDFEGGDAQGGDDFDVPGFGRRMQEGDLENALDPVIELFSDPEDALNEILPAGLMESVEMIAEVAIINIENGEYNITEDTLIAVLEAGIDSAALIKVAEDAGFTLTDNQKKMMDSTAQMGNFAEDVALPMFIRQTNALVEVGIAEEEDAAIIDTLLESAAPLLISTVESQTGVTLSEEQTQKINAKVDASVESVQSVVKAAEAQVKKEDEANSKKDGATSVTSLCTAAAVAFAYALAF